MPNGFKRFLVNNEREVELLLMHNGVFAAEIAHGVSSRKRIVRSFFHPSLPFSLSSSMCNGNLMRREYG
jgi:hypothetical protein